MQEIKAAFAEEQERQERIREGLQIARELLHFTIACFIRLPTSANYGSRHSA